MNKRNSMNVAFVICAVMLVLGAVGGACAAAFLPSDTPLGDIAASLAGGAEASFGTRFGSAILSMGRFHAAVLFLAFSLFGVVGIPLVTGARGFLLSFAVTSLARFCGVTAVLPILGYFAAELLVAVPSLLVLASQSFEASAMLAKHGKPFGGAFLRRTGVVVVVVTLGALADAAVSPRLAGLIFAHFPT